MANDPQFICKNCGYSGKSKKQKKGHFLIEIILWCFMIVPGLIYSVWRRSNRSLVCPSCKQPTLVPTNTPVGQALLKEHTTLS